jgi:hypothetical protein
LEDIRKEYNKPRFLTEIEGPRKYNVVIKYKEFVDCRALESVLQYSTIQAVQRSNILNNHCLVIQLPGLSFLYSRDQTRLLRTVLGVCCFELIWYNTFCISLIDKLGKVTLNSKI